MPKKIFTKASRKRKRVSPSIMKDLTSSDSLGESKYPHWTPEGTILGELKKLLKFLPREVKVTKSSFKVVPPGGSRVKVTAKIRVLKGVTPEQVEEILTQGLDKVQGTQMGPGNQIMFDVSSDLKTITFEKFHF